MAGMNETPKGDRTHIAFFGLRNAGKSTLVNAITGQDLAIVNSKPGTTTDPVSKAMEILPLGPCLLTDTAGLDDDEGELGAQRVKKTLAVLATTDVAVWVEDGAQGAGSREQGSGIRDQGAEIRNQGAGKKEEFLKICEERKVPVLEYRRGDSVEGLKAKIASVRLDDQPRPLVADLVSVGDFVVCVCPIDSAAPKGRLILPQQQVVREILDAGGTAIVCRETELAQTLSKLGVPTEPKHPNNQTPQPSPRFVITDSQAFGVVSKIVPPEIPLTSFSIVFARAKGDLSVFCAGVDALAKLKDGDRVLISEGCTHRRQCGDIGTEKLPKWIAAFSKAKPTFEWTSGGAFPEDLSPYAAVVHCGGCMLTRRTIQDRIRRCVAAGVPIINYGVAIAACHGIVATPETCMVKRGPNA